MRIIFIIFFLFTNTVFTKNIHITSDKIKINLKNQKIYFLGNVKAKQNNLLLKSKKMTAFYKKNDEQKFFVEKIQSYDTINFTNTDIFAVGNIGVYNFRTNELILENNIIINDNISTMFCDRLIYNTFTGKSEIKSNSKNKQITIILEDFNKAKEKYENRK